VRQSLEQRLSELSGRLERSEEARARLAESMSSERAATTTHTHGLLAELKTLLNAQASAVAAQGAGQKELAQSLTQLPPFVASVLAQHGERVSGLDASLRPLADTLALLRDRVNELCVVANNTREGPTEASAALLCLGRAQAGVPTVVCVSVCLSLRRGRRGGARGRAER
jgi:hypothetical protein